VRDYFESADALLVLGVNASDFNFGLGTVQVEEVQTQIILASKDSVRINTALYPAVLLEDLLEGLLSGSLGKHALPKLPAEEAIPAMEPDFLISSDLFFRVLGDHVGEDTIVISDIGDCLFGAGKLRTGYTGFLEPGVYGSMGWSVAASIGAKMADPSLRPLVILGDGALLMGQESAFAKLVELQLDAVIFVMNNQGYATLQGTSPGSFNQIPNLNFERLTEYAGGGRGFRVTTVGELGNVLQTIRSIKGEPVIVNVLLPPYDKTTTLTRVSQALALGLKKGRK
jgi:indolepyruvate decarboxylase